MAQYDLVIVGGGLAGAALAVALRDTPLRLGLVEGTAPCRPSGWDARIYAISPANSQFLSSIGIWRHLDPQRMAPIRAMDIRGDKGGQLNFSAYEAGTDHLGWILESSTMACELWESARRQHNLTLHSPAKPVQLYQDEDCAKLMLDTGEVLSASLIVGADGRDSWVRSTAGLVAHDSPYREKGVVANFRTEKPHHGVARQWFGQDDVLACLPLPEQQISIVWSLPEQRANELLTQDVGELEERVAAAGAYVLGQLACTTLPAAFPLRLIRVPQTVAPRIALIGDAAHGIHPLSGHGINLGFQDAQALSRLLARAIPGQDLGEYQFLRRYARARREETMLMQAATDALRQLFKQQFPGACLLRNTGLNLTNRLSPFKNALARYAMGLI